MNFFRNIYWLKKFTTLVLIRTLCVTVNCFWEFCWNKFHDLETLELYKQPIFHIQMRILLILGMGCVLNRLRPRIYIGTYLIKIVETIFSFERFGKHNIRFGVLAKVGIDNQHQKQFPHKYPKHIHICVEFSPNMFCGVLGVRVKSEQQA